MGKKRPKTTGQVEGTVLAEHRRARHDYEVLERIEAGLVLVGSEVKAIKDGRASLAEAFCAFERDELFLVQCHIGDYVQAHGRNHDPLRRRKLLLHRRQLDDLRERVQRDGLTLIPLDLHLRHRRVKLELALARGRKHHDKRQAIRAREHRREIDRARRGAPE